MKILYYFRNLNTMMYQWQKYHIFDEMRQHNCQFEVISPLDYTEISEANEALVHKCKNDIIDIFMTTFNEKYLYPETLDRIHEMGIPTLLFCPDNLLDPYYHKNIAEYFDLVWLTSIETDYLFKKWGCKTIFQPYAANPFFLKPDYRGEEILRVGFIGTPHGCRIDRINKLLNQNIPVTLHSNYKTENNTLLQARAADYIKTLYDYSRFPIGRKLGYSAVLDKLKSRNLNVSSPWLQRAEPVPLAELARCSCQYGLVLAFTDANSTGILKHPVPIVNLRSFEIPMSGGLQFTTYTDELASYFEEGKEIVLCHSDEEYKEKAQYYLRPEKAAERMQMKAAARTRAESEHTWFCRFTNIFNCLGLQIQNT